jgi:hypothetical protein
VLDFQRVHAPPGNLSLQPEVIGAAAEVKNPQLQRKDYERRLAAPASSDTEHSRQTQIATAKSAMTNPGRRNFKQCVTRNCGRELETRRPAEWQR